VSKRAYPFPKDEFDLTDLSTRPKEVHAARRTLWSRVWPFLVFIVVVPAVALLVLHFLSDDGKKDNKAQDTITATASESPSAEPTDEYPTQDTPDEPTFEPTFEPEEPTQPAPSVDTGTPIELINAAQREGLAASAMQLLTNAGFTATSTGTDPENSPSSPTTVYYSTQAQELTAQKVAQDLGITTAPALDATQGGGGIRVVLRPDYRLPAT
jgi:cytoskeletal protein RodZ